MRHATRAHGGIELLTLDLRLGGLDGGDDVRLSHVAFGPVSHAFPIDTVAGLGEQLDGFFLLLLSHFARLVQAPPKGTVVHRKTVAKQVNLYEAAGGLVFDGELDPGNDGNAVPLGAAEGIDSRERVVIGEGDDAEAGGRVRGNDLLGRAFAVAEDRVQVKVCPSVGYLSQWLGIL